jgi:2-C-methyl-D-erythritol 4-phosphate cytidylyltransferase
VQTPQAFLAAALRAAYERQTEDLAAATDCAGLVESAGMTVTVVDGSPRNVKLTGPADLRLAEALL